MAASRDVLHALLRIQYFHVKLMIIYIQWSCEVSQLSALT